MRRALWLILTAIVLLAILLLPTAAGAAPPAMTARFFYGSVTINGFPAPAGTVIVAAGVGVRTGLQGNPLTTTQSGYYGQAGSTGSKLIVQGDIAEGTRIYIYVNGMLNQDYYTWPADSFEPHITEFSLGVFGGGGGNIHTATPTATPAPATTPAATALPSITSPAQTQVASPTPTPSPSTQTVSTTPLAPASSVPAATGGTLTGVPGMTTPAPTPVPTSPSPEHPVNSNTGIIIGLSIACVVLLAGVVVLWRRQPHK